MEDQEFAVISKDSSGNILVDVNGFVTCTLEGGLQFQVPYKEIDFTCDGLECTVDNRKVYVKLHETTNNTSINKENIISPPVIQNENNTIIQEKRRIDDTFAWTDASTKLFLSIYKEKIELLINRKIKTRKILWDKIREVMQSEGYNVTVIQIENKYKSLERSFKNMITNNKQTGRGRTTCPYQAELTELLGSKHNVESLAVSGREGLILRENVRASTSQFISDPNTNSDENSNILSHNIQEENDNAIEIGMTRDTTTGSNYTNYYKAKAKKIGSTARIVEKCQETVEKFINDAAQEKGNKLEIQRQILTEYKEMRISYEQFLKKIQEQLETSNKLREEKNMLLKELINRQK
ncbi:uncharacterized protein [Temnothorax longispinosus]|uniref:uncharacterized protein n=1 Tax=Temnothorax longispinosus TaxID=300112 RepID=UPI003A991C3C